MCHECERIGATYAVYKGIECVPRGSVCVFYDDAGRLHRHFPIITTNYCCSNNHEWREETHEPCDSCNYGSREDYENE